MKSRTWRTWFAASCAKSDRTSARSVSDTSTCGDDAGLALHRLEPLLDVGREQLLEGVRD